MKQNDELYDVEKKLSAAMADAGAKADPPPFEAIVGRIVRDDPFESFDEFFGDELALSEDGGSAQKGRKKFRTAAIFGLSAAFVLVAGGLAAGVVLSGSLNEKTAMDAAAENAYYDAMTDGNAEREDLEESREDVSYSDLDDCDSAASSQPAE